MQVRRRLMGRNGVRLQLSAQRMHAPAIGELLRFVLPPLQARMGDFVRKVAATAFADRTLHGEQRG